MPDDHARAIAKNRPLKRADGTSPPISFRERFTEHYTILNLDDESRNDQRNALIVQDGCSCWLPSYPAKKQRRARSSILLEEILAFIPKAWEVPHRQFKGVHQSVSGSAVDSCQECSSSLRCQQDHRKRCSACERRNTDSEGSKWPSRSVVGPCDGMFVATCGKCTTICPMARQHPTKNVV